MVVPNLTAATMDAVFAQAAALVDRDPAGGAGELRVILEDVKFIDPYGLVGRWCVLRYLKWRHHAVVVIPPTDPDLQGYLRRMNVSFRHACIAPLFLAAPPGKPAGEPH